MKIAFFTEGNYQGKVPRNHPNMRTELAWMCVLNADHWNINQQPNQQYDLGIVIIPKNNPNFNINKLKQYCNKIAVMQEGPNWYWQDYPLEQQIWYFNTIQEADVMFVHNKSDKKYYEGLTGKECKILPSLMIEDGIDGYTLTHKNDRKNIIIGGNFCSWYGGFDSYIVAQEADCPIYIPSMGRKIEGEEQIPDLTHLPFMPWGEWMHKLAEFKYAIHLMPTIAAGTFAMNCGFLGIPCIGYDQADTQRKIHPKLSVKFGDIEGARKLAFKLKNDSDFYQECSKEALSNYKEYFSEKVFLDKMNKRLS